MMSPSEWFNATPVPRRSHALSQRVSWLSGHVSASAADVETDSTTAADSLASGCHINCHRDNKVVDPYTKIVELGRNFSARGNHVCEHLMNLLDHCAAKGSPQAEGYKTVRERYESSRRNISPVLST